MSGTSKSSPLLSNEFNNKVLKTLGITIISILLVLLLLKGFRVILLVLGGILVATFFLGIADFICAKTPLNKKASLGIAVFLVLAITAGISFALAPSIADQASSLQQELPKAANETLKELKNTKFGSFLVEQVNSLDMNPKGGEVAKFFGSLLGILSTIYIIVFLGIFFMIAPKTYMDGLITLFPKSKRRRTREILVAMGGTLQKWLLGKLLSMLIVGVLTGIGLTLLGVPLALTLAIFAALISFIPNFGPIMALLPAMLLAFTVSPITALYVAILYIGIQAIESNVLTPIIQKKMISLPMAMILIAQIILGLFTGILGVILAVPLMAVVMVFIKMAYIEDVLKDDSITVKYEGSND